MVAHGVLKTVLFGVGVEVTSGCLEVGWLAKRLGVNVDAVLARGKIFEVELDGDLATLGGAEGGCAGVLASAGFEGGDHCSFGCGKDWNSEKTNSECERVTHRNQSPINLFS